MDEPRTADHPPTPEETHAKLTRPTHGAATDPAPDECPAYPEVPGYEVLGILGRGGMGVVYRARQIKANRLVALKMIRAMDDASPTDRLRFQIETEAVARLQHPHIVQLYEVGEVRGQPFFSLEFCDGGTLGEQLKKQRPTPREAAALIETLARAMHYAHLRGVVHRDLKPGNVLLASPGRESGELVPKITDFGLAKRIDAEARDVSQSGAIMGTASYMAPEQAAGKVRDTGPAADVYALGALLYECLAGRPPFEGPQLDVLVRVVSEEPVPPSRHDAKVPRDLETICLKCLHKEPQKRYASAEELADDLRRFLNDEPIHARPVGRMERSVKWVRRHTTVAALAAALLVVSALGVVGIVWKYLDAEEQKHTAQEKEEEAQKEADKARKAREFLLSVFKMSDRKGETGKLTVQQILDHADQRTTAEFVDQPELRFGLESAINELYDSLGVSGPQAMILEARGTVRLESAREPKKQAVPQTFLYQDDRLLVGQDAIVQLLFLCDCRKEHVKPDREVSIHHYGCQPRDAVSERENSILMTFVPLSKGSIYMGWGGKRKVVKTDIKEDFEIAVHDVTQWQWQAVMGANPSFFSRLGEGKTAVEDISEEELKLFPVESVSWDEAQEFIKRLNEKERGSGYYYRLPTEAEWEYACRGMTHSEEECSYHFYFDKPTNLLSSVQANFRLRPRMPDLKGGNTFEDPYGTGGDIAVIGAGVAALAEEKDSWGKTKHTTRVGAYPSNKLGLCDMNGNVRQWCADTLEGDSNRSSRGGSWKAWGDECQAANRRLKSAMFHANDIGFRLVRVPVR